MKVYLDDRRKTPDGWVRTYTASGTINKLKTGEVTELSLDHDIGNNESLTGNGYDVILWIEREVALHGFTPPKIKVHSSNSSARIKMEAGIRMIERLAERNKQ